MPAPGGPGSAAALRVCNPIIYEQGSKQIVVTDEEIMTYTPFPEAIEYITSIRFL